MIMVDSRIGSKELHPYFIKSKIPTDLCELPFGDFAFNGNGPQGKCLVGIERKRIRDMMHSIRSGRYAGHQLNGMLDMYDHTFLVIEGIFRPNPDSGVLEERRGRTWEPLATGSVRYMWSELVKFQFTISSRTFGTRERPKRVQILPHTSLPSETAALVLELYRWYNGKLWDDHGGHLNFDTSDTIEVLDKPFVQRVAKELTGVGWRKSLAISRHFGGNRRTESGLEGMMDATLEDWANLQVPISNGKTQRIGLSSAKTIMKELHGEGK